jgi:hypothetical protein
MPKKRGSADNKAKDDEDKYNLPLIPQTLLLEEAAAPLASKKKKTQQLRPAPESESDEPIPSDGDIGNDDNSDDGHESDDGNDSDDDIASKQVDSSGVKQHVHDKRSERFRCVFANPNYAARFAVPTADEMRHLRETEQLYSSNVLRLQLDALIDDSTILNKSTGALQQWMRDLKAHMTRSLPPAQQPVHCGVAGSFLSQTCLRGRLNADIVVVMPTPSPAPDTKGKSSIAGGTASTGLHMSGALFPHIAHYTLLLADTLKGFCSTEAICSRGHKHVCCVSCAPHGASLSGMERSFTVRLHVIADASKLPHKRFSPSHNNFRPSVPVTPYPPTPHYNSSLMEVSVSASPFCLMLLLLAAQPFSLHFRILQWKP